MEKHWKSYRIKDIGTVVTGKTPQSQFPEHFGNLIPFVTPTDFKKYNKNVLSAARSISESGKQAHFKKILPVNSILVTCIGSDMGKVAINRVECLTNQQLNSIVVNNKIAEPDFVYYSLKSLYEILKSMSTGGSTMPIVNKGDFENIILDLPPLPEQRQIAVILSSLDDKIELNRRMNQTLEQLAQTLFQQWFVAFNFPDAAGQPYRSSGGELVESEVGEIPKGWRVGILRDIITELETGTRPKGGVSMYTSGIPSIGAESIVGVGQFDFSKTKYVPEEYFATMRRGFIKSRDVLIYKDGGKPGNFTPHISMFGEGFPFTTCCVNDHVYRLRVKDNAQNFIYLWLSSDPIMNEMRQKGTGAAIPGLNSTALKSLTTLLPINPILASFESLVEPLFTQIISNSKQSRTLSTLRDNLLPQLLSGRLTVRQAAELVG